MLDLPNDLYDALVRIERHHRYIVLQTSEMAACLTRMGQAYDDGRFRDAAMDARMLKDKAHAVQRLMEEEICQTD